MGWCPSGLFSVLPGPNLLEKKWIEKIDVKSNRGSQEQGAVEYASVVLFLFLIFLQSIWSTPA
jgi:hypothetical protein